MVIKALKLELIFKDAFRIAGFDAFATYLIVQVKVEHVTSALFAVVIQLVFVCEDFAGIEACSALTATRR